MNNCPSCGAETRPGDSFCLTCGNRLFAADSSPHRMPFMGGDATSASGQGFPPPTNPSVSHSYVRLGMLLVLMGIFCVLLLEGLLEFPGIFFWFLGGDLMQFWFLVLVVLGFLYRGTLSRLQKRAKRGWILTHQYQSFSPEPSGSEWLASAQQRSGRFIQALLRAPLVLLVGFLIFYFFIQGYTIHIRPHPTIAGECNGGTMTVQANTTTDTVSMKAGLLTIEGFGNYDGANNVLNVNGNLCGFTLGVPANTNLHLSGNDATLSVTGVTGKLELDNNAGDINIDGSTLLAGSVINNNAGNITITNSHLMPEVTVTSNSSPIHIVSSTINGAVLSQGQYQIEHCMLTGTVQIEDQAQVQDSLLSNATITAGDQPVKFIHNRVNGFAKITGGDEFTGTLTSGSSLTIIDHGGHETITLPAGLPFHLDASGVTSFSSNDLALQGLDQSGLASSDGVHVNIGADPQTTVTIQGQGDTLQLNRGGS